MDDTEFTDRLNAAAGSIDASRWALAELALDAKQDEYKDWADRIAHHVKVRRKVRTVRDWALAADFRRSLAGARPDLVISFYLAALKFFDKVDGDAIIELMRTAEAEGVTLEDFTNELREMAGVPAPDPGKRWKKFAEKLYGEIDSYVPAVAEHLREAAVALEGAASALALEVANAEQAAPVTAQDVADAILARRETVVA
jgi:hypothetical protein